jgi:hypothetical protein
MRKIFTSVQLDVLSDVFSGLASGWFGTVLILPGIWQSVKLTPNQILILLSAQIICGILSVIISMYLRERAKYAN